MRTNQGSSTMLRTVNIITVLAIFLLFTNSGSVFVNDTDSVFNELAMKASCEAKCFFSMNSSAPVLNVDALAALAAYDDIHEKTDDGCVGSCVNDANVPFNNSDILVNAPSRPVLHCRSDAFVMVKWDMEKLSFAVGFVLEIRNRANLTWHPYSSTPFTMATLQNLKSSAEYQVQVWAVSLDGGISEPSESDWFTTPEENFLPMEVSNISIKEVRAFSTKAINVTVQWEPAEDRMCYYHIVWWDRQRNEYSEISITDEQFEIELKNLDLNTNYSINVMSLSYMDYSYKQYVRRESDKLEFNFTTPACLDLYPDDLQKCSPPPVQNMSAQFYLVGADQYEIILSWIPPRLIPEEYAVELKQMVPPRNFSVEQQVFGNKTSVRFQNIKSDTLYMMCVTPISAGGNDNRKCSIYRHLSSVPANSDGQMALAIYLPILLITTTATAVIIFLYRSYKKRKENERRHQYFEGLEKQACKEIKACESAGLFIPDEWEISEDRLLLGDVLGEGAFGIVRKGLLQGHSQLEPLMEVAVKMLRDDPTTEDIRQFQQEINMVKSVGQHPNIVSIIGCCTHRQSLRLIVEYCAFGDLQNYLRKVSAYQLSPVNMNNLNASEATNHGQIKYAELLQTPSSENGDDDDDREIGIVVNKLYFEGTKEEKLPQEESLSSTDLLSFARQIAMGMEFLASNRIVHRDLAARNVLVCSNKMVKISDFGLSRDIYERNVYHKKGAGKLPIKWMAIESLLYQVYTTQSDIWSFGILLWEIVTLGGNPYPSIRADRVYKLLQSGYRMECPQGCSLELYQIMLSCWEAKPRDRPTFSELCNRLDDLLESSTPQQYLNLNLMILDSPSTPPEENVHSEDQRNISTLNSKTTSNSWETERFKLSVADHSPHSLSLYVNV